MTDADGITITEMDSVTNGTAILAVEDIDGGVIRLALGASEEDGYLGYDQAAFIAAGWRKVVEE